MDEGYGLQQDNFRREALRCISAVSSIRSNTLLDFRAMSPQLTQARAGGRGGAVGEICVDRMEVPDRVAVSGAVCGYSRARATTEMDALCAGVVLECAAAKPLRLTGACTAGGAHRLGAVPAGRCLSGSLLSEDSERRPGVLTERVSCLYRAAESRGVRDVRAGASA